MYEKRVRDIMVPIDDYPSIPETLTLRDAVEEIAVQIVRRMQTSFPRVVLVFDDDFTQLRGLLRRRDIMRALEPEYLIHRSSKRGREFCSVEEDPNLAELTYDKISAHMRGRSNLLAGQFMTPIVATIAHDAHLLTAMSHMVSRNVSLLPVMEGTSVVGVVRSMEVLSEIALIISE